MYIKNFNRTEKSPVFMNSYARDAIRLATKQLHYSITSRNLDVGKDYEDIEGEMYILWCECCEKHKEMPEEYVVKVFEKKASWYRMDFIKEYFAYIEGRKIEKGPDPFDPDFYQFTDMYRNGKTIDELAEHYGVSVRTIKTYIQDNFVTKYPINPQDYLNAHKKIYGKDPAYWNIRNELITEFDVD